MYGQGRETFQSDTVSNPVPVLSQCLMLCLMQACVYKALPVFMLEPLPPFRGDNYTAGLCGS